MDPHQLIRDDGERFYTVAAATEPSLGVPSCPEWTVEDLVWHLGRVHWFWATDIETGAKSRDQLKPEELPKPERYPELVDWARSQLHRLLAVLEGTADGSPAWTWAADPGLHNTGFIRRHQVQETAVHRWDLQFAALGHGDPIDAEAASDAIDEFLSVSLPFDVTPGKPLSGSVHLHCTDVPGEWFVHPDGSVERVHAKGDVAIRGSASGLLLALYRRIPVESLDVIGDPSVARQLVEHVDTE